MLFWGYSIDHVEVGMALCPIIASKEKAGDDPSTWWSDPGYTDGGYVIYKQDGTYLDFDYYTGIACYRIHSGGYKDSGNGNISLDDKPSYQFSIAGNIMTVSHSGGSYTATESNLTGDEFNC